MVVNGRKIIYQIYSLLGLRWVVLTGSIVLLNATSMADMSLSEYTVPPSGENSFHCARKVVHWRRSLDLK